MRLSIPLSLLLALAGPSSAAEPPAQKPILANFQSWLSAAAQSYLPSAVQAYLPSAATKLSSSNVLSSTIAPPLEAVASVAAAAVAAATPTAATFAAPAASITPLTTENWRTILSPSPSRASPDLDGRETWMVLVSGGNRTCLGHCEHLEAEWNKTATLITADPLTAATAPRLGYVSCDISPVLCALWGARPVTLWHVQFPAVHVHVHSEEDGTTISSSGSGPNTGTSAETDNPTHPPFSSSATTTTTIRIIPLNMTSTTAQDLLETHTEKKFEAAPVYDSVFHPFDGLLATTGLALPVAYVLAGFARIPTWSYMLIISFLSRNIMNRRTNPNPNAQPRPQPPPPPAAAGGGRS